VLLYSEIQKEKEVATANKNPKAKKNLSPVNTSFFRHFLRFFCKIGLITKFLSEIKPNIQVKIRLFTK